MDLQLVSDGGGAVEHPDAPGLPADLEPNADGTFRIVPRPGPFRPTFAPISLYLAGFIPPAQVPAMFLVGGLDLSDPERITVDQVIALEGPRAPASAEAPRAFTVGTIVIGDRPYSEAEYTFITLALRYWESTKPYVGLGAPPWNAATLGQSSITVALPGLSLEGPPPDGSRAAQLLPGWNMVGWTGPATTPTEATAGIAASIGAVFAWEAQAETFLRFDPAAPPFLNSLTEFSTGEGLWLFVPPPALLFWEQPEFTGPRSVPLQAGFNLVTWTGPDGASVADAVAGLGGALRSLFVWDAGAQTFRSYNPAQPAFLNTATQLRFGDGLWIEVATPLTWEGPAP